MVMDMIKLLALFTVFAGILLGSAGRLDLPFVWAYLGVLAAVLVTGARLMDPDLRRERIRPGAGGTDRKLRALAMPCLLAHLIVAGLDVGRFHWSDAVPSWLHVVGLTGLAVFMGLTLWAVKVNRFFSPVVRIQSERGHHLIQEGPYRWIRHPGYLAALFAFPCGALALGSWWSLVPLLPATGLMLRRTIIEDRYLREHLDGYQAYASRVRYRLIPKVW